MDLHPALTATFAIAAGLVAVATLWRTVLGPTWRKVMAAIRLLDQFLDDWNGEPEQPARPGKAATPARPGVLARLDHQAETLHSHTKAIKQIQHEVLPNNGGSLRDAVDRQGRALTAHVTASEADRADLRRGLDELRAERAPTTHVEVQLNTPTKEE